jgi:hypothetical protein
MKNWACENSILRNAVPKKCLVESVLANLNASRMPQSDGASMTRSLMGGLIEADELFHSWENFLGGDFRGGRDKPSCRPGAGP